MFRSTTFTPHINVYLYITRYVIYITRYVNINGSYLLQTDKEVHEGTQTITFISFVTTKTKVLSKVIGGEDENVRW